MLPSWQNYRKGWLLSAENGATTKSWKKILHAFPRDAHNILTRLDSLHKIFCYRPIASPCENGQDL